MIKYDVNHNIYKIIHPRNGGETIFNYDSLHRLDDITDPEGNITDYVYYTGNLKDRPDEIIDPENKTTKFTYYPINNTGYDGNLWKTEDPDGYIAEHTYYDNGLLLGNKYPGITPHELFGYWSNGSLAVQIDLNGLRTQYLRNDNNQITELIRHITIVYPTPSSDPVYVGALTETRTYDNNGNLESITDPEGSKQTFKYNPSTKVTKVIFNNETATEDDDPYIEKIYDVRGWLWKEIDQEDRTTEYEYYANGKIKKIIAPMNRVTEFNYDKNGDLLSEKDPRGNITSYENKPDQPQTTVTDPLTQTIINDYDKLGNIRYLTNRRGHRYEMRYDGNQRQTHQISPSPALRSWVTDFNKNGTIKKFTEPSLQEVDYTYDSITGRLQKLEDDVGTIEYTEYDNNGNLKTLIENNTHTIHREYDEYNRIKLYRDQNGNEIEYRYYKNDQLHKLIYPDDKEVTYTYYKNNLMHTVTDWNNRVTTYHYYEDGRLKKIERHNGSIREYIYDDAGRLQIDVDRDANQELISYFKYSYTPNDEIENLLILPYPQEFTPSQVNENDVSYDEENRLLTFNGQSVTHDDDGNMTTGPDALGNSITYTYDSRNRLSNMGSQSYTYDAKNNRITVTENSQLTKYVINPHTALSQVLVREKQNGDKTFYVYGLGLAYEVNESEFTKSYHYDHRGCTVAITDDSSYVTDRVEYSPYGDSTNRVGSSDTPFLFNGKYGVMTDANGLLYMRARYYSTTIRRFINADPIQFGGGMNWYMFASNNPLNFIDPTGLKVGDWWDVPANFNHARQIAIEELQNRPTDHNNIGDALRHATWNKRMVEEIGPGTAWFAGTGHEFENLFEGGPLDEILMDLNNNAEGRKAARENRPIDKNKLEILDPNPNQTDYIRDRINPQNKNKAGNKGNKKKF